MIELHYVHTANVLKVRLMLLETELPYSCVPYDLKAGEHLSPQFGRLNPNRKLPTIRDLDPADGGLPITVFESGAILIYLSEKTGKFLPQDPRLRSRALQWLIWQVAGLGPMSGQAAHFHIYAPEKIPYAIERYDREVQRLLNVLEQNLENGHYLAEEYSIADIACWPVVNILQHFVPLTAFPSIQRWLDLVGARPAAQAAFSTEGLPSRLFENRTELTPTEWSNLHGDNLLAAVKNRGD